MTSKLCDVCGVRPAVVTVRRIVPGGGQRIEHLCDVHAAEARGGRSPFGGSPLGGGSIFDDFFGRFFDEGPVGKAAGGTAPRRQAEQVDITQFFSDSTTGLLQRAARVAVEWGSLDLNTEHLLYAALEDKVVRRALEAVDADPGRIRAQLEEEVQSGGRTDVSPSLAPDAKRALLAAYEESRALGSSYIGPEHVLLALARDDEGEAGRLLDRFGLSHTKLRGAVVRGVDPGGEACGGDAGASSTPTVDEFSRDLTQMAREGKLDPVIGRSEEVETTIEILSRRTKNNPVLIGDPGVGKTAIVEGIAQRIVNDEVPETLSGKRVLALDLSGIVAGTQYRGQFEERLKKVIDEIRESSEDQIVFIDELHTVSRLVGAPPGYVGYEEAGQLTEQVRRRPYSVLLLDEIEKAHPDVFNILLQILDDGRLTDSQGRTVDFKNAVVIMTSNLGSERIQAHARRDESFEELKEDMLQILKRNLRPEFLNRIDETIVFRALDEEQIADIARLLLERTRKRLRAQDIEVEFTEEAVRLVSEEGFDPEFGARPLRRTIQRRVDNELARMVLDGSLKPRDRVVVGIDGEAGKLTFEAVEGVAVAGGSEEGRT